MSYHVFIHLYNLIFVTSIKGIAASHIPCCRMINKLTLPLQCWLWLQWLIHRIQSRLPIRRSRQTVICVDTTHSYTHTRVVHLSRRHNWDVLSPTDHCPKRIFLISLSKFDVLWVLFEVEWYDKLRLSLAYWIFCLPLVALKHLSDFQGHSLKKSYLIFFFFFFLTL